MSGPTTAGQLLAALSACSTSLPAPSRVVSTWYCHSHDQPNQGVPIKVHSLIKPRICEPTRLILSCRKQQIILARFLMSRNPLRETGVPAPRSPSAARVFWGIISAAQGHSRRDGSGPYFCASLKFLYFLLS